MNPAISITGLSKRYRHRRELPYRSLREVIGSSLRELVNRKSPEYFWALKDLDLTLTEGDRIGIIGHNGAGKSTLLKIISRITPPTAGEVLIQGRVASLLEVGTGFHPELTGRENIYLNGSILGLKKKEIDARLEEIIDFSGVEAFIDTPLKNYSSGMQLRLAFSVAAHLEAEIILIDEVLAVGDMEFQRKCIGKMEEVSRQSGRTIVFVSHNMAAVRQLCNRGLVLKEGSLLFQGTIGEALNAYTASFLHSVSRAGHGVFELSAHPNKVRRNEGLQSARLLVNGQPAEEFLPGSQLEIQLRYFLNTALQDPEIGLVIKDEEYHALLGLNNKHLGQPLSLRTGAAGEASIRIPSLNVYTPGRYRVDLYFGDQYHFYECLYDAFEFQVLEHDVYGAGVELKPEWNRIFIPDIQITAG